jgi:hypothetical protein
MDAGSWVIFELPGFTTAASGTEQTSVDALRTASDTSYFKARDALWVKVVSNGNGARGPIGGGPGGGTSLQVSRKVAPCCQRVPGRAAIGGGRDMGDQPPVPREQSFCHAFSWAMLGEFVHNNS